MVDQKKRLIVNDKQAMGVVEFRDLLLGWMRDHLLETKANTFPVGGWFHDGVTPDVTFSGSEFSAVAGSLGAVKSSDVTGYIMTGEDWAYDQDVPFENNPTTNYFVRYGLAEIPSAAKRSLITGDAQYVAFETVVGVARQPTSATVQGDNTIVFDVESLLLLDEDDDAKNHSYADRKVAVFLNDPASDLPDVYIEVCDVVYDAGPKDNWIQTTGSLGQVTPSGDASDYTIVLLGPHVTRYDFISTALADWFNPKENDLATFVAIEGGTPPTRITSLPNYPDMIHGLDQISKLFPMRDNGEVGLRLIPGGSDPIIHIGARFELEGEGVLNLGNPSDGNRVSLNGADYQIRAFHAHELGDESHAVFFEVIGDTTDKAAMIMRTHVDERWLIVGYHETYGDNDVDNPGIFILDPDGQFVRAYITADGKIFSNTAYVQSAEFDSLTVLDGEDPAFVIDGPSGFEAIHAVTAGLSYLLIKGDAADTASLEMRDSSNDPWLIMGYDTDNASPTEPAIVLRNSSDIFPVVRIGNDGDISVTGDISAQGTITATTSIGSDGAITGDSMTSDSFIAASGFIVNNGDIQCSSIDVSGDVEANKAILEGLEVTDGAVSDAKLVVDGHGRIVQGIGTSVVVRSGPIPYVILAGSNAIVPFDFLELGEYTQSHNFVVEDVWINKVVPFQGGTYAGSDVLVKIYGQESSIGYLTDVSVGVGSGGDIWLGTAAAEKEASISGGVTAIENLDDLFSAEFDEVGGGDLGDLGSGEIVVYARVTVIPQPGW